MKYIVAVSGGVDSVSLLDMLAQTTHELVVVHFDHGIRKDSQADAKFVSELAARYNLPFVSERVKLGRKASEEEARAKRYEFLRRVAREYDGRIVTAHHRDDVIESIIMNLNRGTGWRGLAVMGASDIARPLLGMSKAELHDYARVRGLEWREDPTNASDAYARNRIRHQVLPKISHADRVELATFHAAQLALKRAIDEELASLSAALKSPEGYSRHFFVMASESPALEVLGAVIKQEKGISLTRPQLARLLLAIKTGRAGSKHHAGNKLTLKLTKTNFVFA